MSCLFSGNDIKQNQDINRQQRCRIHKVGRKTHGVQIYFYSSLPLCVTGLVSLLVVYKLQIPTEYAQRCP